MVRSAWRNAVKAWPTLVLVDPEGYAEDAERVTRGGGWNNLAWSISATSRNGYPPGARFSNLGFRCAVG